MTFDPHNVRRYVIESRGQGDPGAVLVAARDYDQLLDMLNDAKRQGFNEGVQAAIDEIEDEDGDPELQGLVSSIKENLADLKEERK